MTGLDNGVEHTFQLRAVSVVGEGAPASDTSTPVTVPGAPASLDATAGDTQVTLDWTAPTSDGGSAVTGYQYRMSADGGTTWSPDWTGVTDGSDTGTDRSDERSYIVTGLANGVEHTFEVRAVSVVGDGAPASATATPMTTPTLPLSLDTIAGDDVVNIAEKAAGFAITGETGSVDAASVTVTIGSDTLTATSASSGAWTVTVPADASYLTGASVDVTVNATKAGYNAAVELTSTLAVDLVRPSVQTAELSGTSLTLGYSEGLDGSSTPAADALHGGEDRQHQCHQYGGTCERGPGPGVGQRGGADPGHCCASGGHGDGGLHGADRGGRDACPRHCGERSGGTGRSPGAQRSRPSGLPQRHGGGHAGDPDLDGADLRRGLRRHRVRVPCERRRRHLLES